MAEYANNLFSLFWYNAAVAAKQIDDIPDNTKRYWKLSKLLFNITKWNLIKKLKSITFGIIEKKAVKLKKEPSYTSQSQKWNGNAPNLNKMAKEKNRTPHIADGQKTKELNRSKDSKEKVPNEAYTNENPNKMNPEVKAPKIKYFIPASTQNSEFLLNDAKA
jgi:DNA-binding HxlR family transcriptional regulator